MTTQEDIFNSRQFSQKDLSRTPRPPHRHAAPYAPWPWIDQVDGLFFGLSVSRPSITNDEFAAVDPRQLESMAPPIPCDHSPDKCNSCWRGYPQSHFPNWSRRQVEKAKIYKVIHNYSISSKPCTCYRVDMNDRGFFTNTNQITSAYGDEDNFWQRLIHEEVSCSLMISGALPQADKILL